MLKSVLMNTIHYNDTVQLQSCVATIGFFDGVHRGHQFLIHHLVETARMDGLQSTVITFDAHPRKVLQADYQPEMLSTLDSKLLLLSKTEVDNAVVLHFDKAMAAMSAREFMQHELSSAYIRPGMYGGSFENRTRLLRNGIQAAKAYETDQFLVTARIGIYDGFAYPYGFGVKEGEGIIPNLEEPIRLIRELHEDYQMPMVNLTMGNPYVSIHVTRPYDMGKYIPDEHPLYGIARMIHGIGEVKKAVPQMAISASAPTYLRQYSDLYAAGAIEEGLCDQMLFGRLSFADPDFPNQIRDTGRIDPKKVCVTCGKCGDLIRAGKPTGCVVRNPENYLQYYREYQEENR